MLQIGPTGHLAFWKAWYFSLARVVASLLALTRVGQPQPSVGSVELVVHWLVEPISQTRASSTAGGVLALEAFAQSVVSASQPELPAAPAALAPPALAPAPLAPAPEPPAPEPPALEPPAPAVAAPPADCSPAPALESPAEPPLVGTPPELSPALEPVLPASVALPLDPPLAPAWNWLPQALHSVMIASKSFEFDMGLRRLRVSKGYLDTK